MGEHVPIHQTPKALIAAMASILGKISPYMLHKISQEEHLDYRTLMILAGHLKKQNGRTKIC